MASLDQENVRVQVLIVKDTELGRYQDAVYFSPDEFAALDQKALEDLKQARADNWVASVKEASKIDYNPSKEELEAEKAELVAQVDELDVKIAAK